MKKNALLLTIYCVLGISTLLLQTVVEPLTANGIPAILQNPVPGEVCSLLIYMSLFCICEIGNTLCSSFSTIIKELLVGRSVAKRMQNAMRKILHTNSDYLNNDAESIINTVSTDIEICAGFFVTAILELPLIIVGLIITFFTMCYGSFPCLTSLVASVQKGDTMLAVLVLAMSPLQFAFLLYNRKLRNCDQIKQDASNSVIQKSTESVRGIIDIRSANAFPFAIARIQKSCASYYKARIKMFSIITALNSISGFVWAFSRIVLLSVCSWFIFHKTNNFSYPDYVGFTALAIAFNAYVSKAIQFVMEWQTSCPAIKRMSNIFRLDNTFADATADSSPLDFHSLSFKDIFYEPTPDTKILMDINLSIKAGEHVAIVGPSGCGKSTLLKMAMRHLTPTQGSICLNEHPINKLSYSSYARTIAYVSQRPFIFNGTIRENILVGRDALVTDKRLYEILDEVALSDDLRRKNTDIDKALNFELHVGGQELSGGQMAKIALARALVGNPSVLLLDEVTAPLDELSQQRIIEVLEKNYRNKTIISINHRLPTVRNSHQIVVMDSGRIVQIGNYNSLSHEKGLFATLLARDTQTSPIYVESNLSFGNDIRGTVQTLSMCVIFSGVPTDLLTTLASQTKISHFEKGAHIVKKGDFGDSLFIIQSGTIEVNNQKFGAGSCFGEIAVFYGGIRSADVIATSDCTTLSINRETIFECINQHPNLAKHLLAETARIALRESYRC